MPRGGSKPGERRGGRQKGTPNKLPKGERALVKLDKAEAEVRALVAEGLPLETLGKDRLTELDAWKATARPSSPMPASLESKALSRSGRALPTVPAARLIGSK